MRLPRFVGLGLIGLFTASCSETTTPHPASGYYVLESVNGQPLPAVLVPIPEETISVLFGYLALDDDSDKAISVETRREVHQNIPRETAYANTFRYLIDGNTIQLLPNCPPNALCATLDGVVSDSTVTLTVRLSSPDQPLIYLYRRAALPENWSPGL